MRSAPLGFAPTILQEIAPDRIELRPTFARLRGIELSGTYREGPLSLWTSIGWSRAFDRFGDRSELRNWDQTWALTGGGRWGRGPWLFSTALDVHHGWPTTELQSGPTGLVLEPRNASRLATYVGIDLRGQYTWRLQDSELGLRALAAYRRARGRSSPPA